MTRFKTGREIPPFFRNEVAVKLLKVVLLVGCVVVYGPISPSWSADLPAAKADSGDAEKTMAKLSQLVGGTLDQHGSQVCRRESLRVGTR